MAFNDGKQNEFAQQQEIKLELKIGERQISEYNEKYGNSYEYEIVDIYWLTICNESLKVR